MALVLTQQTPLQTSPTASLQAALRLFEDALSPEQRTNLYLKNSTTIPSDVIVLVSEIDAANQSRRRSAASRLFSFLDNAQQFVGVVDTFVSSNPNIAALVWGGIKMSILVANNNLPYFDKVTAMITKIGRLSPTFVQFGHLYSNDAQVQTVLCDYYAVVIRICTKIIQIQNRSSFSFTRLVSSFELDFNPLLHELEQEQKRILVQLHLASHKATHALTQMTAKEHETNRLHRLFSSNFQSASLREQERIRESIAEQRRGQILNNFSKIKAREIWSTVQAQRVIGTAEWFHQESSFKDWRESPQTSILWCSGILGAGKSVLVSSIVAYLEQSRSVTDQLSYHFCQTGHEITLNARGILGNITRQLLANFVHQLWDSDLQELLNKSEDISTGDLIILLESQLRANAMNTYFVILDGLDECPEIEVRLVLSQLKRIVETQNVCVKLLYTSRPDLETVFCKSLQYDAKLTLTKEVLQSDVERYVDVTLQQYIDEERLKIQDANLFLRIVSVLENGYDGMLLWLSLFIEELCIMNDDAAIIDALEHPPNGIKELYDRKLLRLRSHRLSQDSLNALRYTGVATRPLTIGEMREVLSVTLDQEELDPTRLPNDMDRILRACGGLLRVDEGTRQLYYVHSSLYSYLFPSGLEHIEGFHRPEIQLHFSCLCMTYLNFKNFSHQVIPRPKETKQFQPLDIALAQVRTSESLTSRLAQRLLTARRSRSSIDAQQILNQICPGPREPTFDFELLKYAGEYWLKQIEHLAPAREAEFWEILHRCINNENLDKWKPWLTANKPRTNGSAPSSSSTNMDEMARWALSNKHVPLVLYQFLYRKSDDIDEAVMKIMGRATQQNDGFSVAILKYFLETKSLQYVLKRRDVEKYLSQALTDSVGSGEKELVRAFLEAGADLNITFMNGWTPLHEAARNGHIETVERILAAKVYINDADTNGSTPLSQAASEGHVQILTRLLAAGANPNPPNTSVYTPLRRAASSGQAEIVNVLLSAGAYVDGSSYCDKTPLQDAIANGHGHIAERLLIAGADVNNSGGTGETPLFAAISTMDHKLVWRLLEGGADINIPDDSGQTPLHEAVFHKYTDIVRVLLDAGADVNYRNGAGLTALHMSSGSEHTEIMGMLLTAGADVSSVDDRDRTPLHMAASKGAVEGVKRLLAAGADTKVQDMHSGTPLHDAVWSGSVECVEMLLAAGADTESRDSAGDTPLELSQRLGRFKIEEMRQPA